MKPLKILYPFSFLYYLGFVISQKIKKSRQRKLPCKVISVGNITVGGTGKTPAVIYLAELLKSLNKKVCVISRGYKGQARGTRHEARVRKQERRRAGVGRLRRTGQYILCC